MSASSHDTSTNFPSFLIKGAVNRSLLVRYSWPNRPLTQSLPKLAGPSTPLTLTMWLSRVYTSIWHPTPQYSQVVTVFIISQVLPLPTASFSMIAPTGHDCTHSPHPSQSDSLHTPVNPGHTTMELLRSAMSSTCFS